ncbi:MAG TPA: undecaprenyldiphospho-muramoylpentapeptide beta-N-acetylglucosaminyltransferase [Eubacterium sp.]|nr:undecaprenyldiphospho-muramoylpentapeptide beta-N-acetylglucosaminyltransferase [Eubacterium sp.]
MSKKIILTGGGTAGHVIPNIALLPALKDADFEIMYVGSYKGIERTLIEKEGLYYKPISSGKLRRYFSIQNFIDPFKVIRGYFQAKKIIKKYNPDVVFSKGGFVSVPVVMAASKKKVPVICHESDLTPGLANKLSMKYANKICHTFPETARFLGDKGVFTGSPVRSDLKTGDKQKGIEFCGFKDDKPVILVVGGSLGAAAINKSIRSSLDTLLKDFNIIHLCGKEKLDENKEGIEGYKQFEYVNEEMKDLFAACDIIVSRAGSNAIWEFVYLNKPAILIPLPAASSRGDQILNAKSFKKQGFCEVLNEEDLTDELLISTIEDMYKNKDKYIDAMNKSEATKAVDKITKLLIEACK